MPRHATEVIDLLSDSDGEERGSAPNVSRMDAVPRSGNESSEEDDLCCPVADEPYQEKGAHQPLILPACGHTFSRATVEGLLKLHKQKRILCPLCNTKQTTIQKVEKCPPNWDTIRRVLQKAEKRKKCAAHKGAADKVAASPAQRITVQHVTATAAVPAAGTSHKSDTPVQRRTRRKAASGHLTGDEVPRPKAVRKKKTKASSAKKPAMAAPPVPPPVAPSPLMEKVQKAEFDARAIKVLGQAHKKRR